MACFYVAPPSVFCVPVAANYQSSLVIIVVSAIISHDV